MCAKIVARGARSRGQSTVEFMLMIPVIFAMFFFIIEMGLFFSAVHYANYATFVTARSQQVAYGEGAKDTDSLVTSPEQIAQMVLTGSVFRRNLTVTEETVNGVGGAGISIALKHWQTNFPYLSALLPNMPFTLKVYLGPNEFEYEKRALDNDNDTKCVDNDVRYNQC